MSTINQTDNRACDCDLSRLEVLLQGDELSEEFQVVSLHLESCAYCQQHLTALAADDQSWNEISSLLNQSNQPEIPDFDTDSSTNHLDLGFLEEPSHPEMLGSLGRYEIERVIGSGGMGIVLKGYDTELNRPVALKVLAPFLANNGAARQRFAREGRAAAAIVHEHVVAIHNVESDAKTPFLVMQYVPGQSLQARVDERGPLSVKEILRIGMQAASGLAAAHAQGVVHRDIKPSNILLENDLERVLLTDFGLARAADDATVTQTGIVAGTPHYMSPEQANGQPIDQRSDLFSLGALLYFMCTGHPPFRAERAMAVLHRICHDRQRSVWEVNEEIPDQLSNLIDRLLEKKPGKRFASAEAVEGALRKMLEKSQRPRKLKVRKSWQRKLRQRSRLVLAGCLLLAAISVYIFRQTDWFGGMEIPITPHRTMISKPIQKTRSTQPRPEPATAEVTFLEAEEVIPPKEESPFFESFTVSPEPVLEPFLDQPVPFETIPTESEMVAAKSPRTVPAAPVSPLDSSELNTQIENLTAQMNRIEAGSGQGESRFLFVIGTDDSESEMTLLKQQLEQLEQNYSNQNFYQGE